MTTGPFEGLPPLNLPPGSALVFQASLWLSVMSFGPRSYEQRAREHLHAAIERAPGDLSAVHANVREAALACLHDPTNPARRRDLNRALDEVLDHARRQPPAPSREDLTPVEEVWYLR